MKLLQKLTLSRSALLSGLITLLAFIFRLPQFFTEPGKWLLADTGDGIKNYFTVIWQIAHGKDSFNFMGMNYPYGEHIFYTDGHPLFTWCLQRITGSELFALPLLNLLLLLSFPVAAFIGTRLLQELGSRNWIAVMGGVVMALLSPQLFRLGGHYALSWAFFIPALILQMILWWRSGRHRYWVGSTLLVLTAWLTHGYLGAMCSGFLLLMTILRFIMSRQARELLSLFAAVLPIVLFLLILRLTDIHAGRTSNPAGLFLYMGEPDDIFLPNSGPLFEWIHSGIPVSQQWEAMAYVGLPTVLCLLAMVLLGLKRPTCDPQRQPIWIAALVLLMFAFGFPFKQFPQLAEFFPVVKQFRGTGRFVWPFYYTAVIFAIAWMDRQSRDSGSALRRMGLPVLYFFLIGADAASHFLRATHTLGKPNCFVLTLRSEQVMADAMLPLPFFHHGSESYEVPRDEEAMRNAMVYSFQTGIPLMAANLTRISIPESRSIIQLMGKPWYDKPLLEDLQGKQFLLYIAGQPRPEENWIVETAGLSSETGQRRMIQPNLLADGAAFEVPQAIDLPIDSLASAFPNGGWLMSFEDQPSDTTLHGSGAFRGLKRSRHILKTILPGDFPTTENLRVAIWFYEDESDALNLYFRLLIEEYTAEGEMTRQLEFFPERNVDFFNGWSLTRASIPSYDPARNYVICTEGKSNSKARLHADLLGIWPAGDTLFLPLNINGVEMTYFNGDLIPIE